MNRMESLNNEDYEVVDTVTLTLDDGTETECQIITVFAVGEEDYIALLPLTGPDKDTGSVYLYGYREDEEGEPEIRYIEDDAEYEAASEAFDEYLDSAEFDELVSEEEET